MIYEDFVAEAQQLKKRAVKLSFSGSGQPLGYWHGRESPNGVLISVKHGAKWLNVVLNDPLDGKITFTDTPITSPQPLFGEEFDSLPPVDGVFLRGSDAVGAFIRSKGWERTDAFNDNFPSEVPGEYEGLWQENCPLYSNDIVAVLGGWHFPWPDGDWYELEPYELVLWVLQDAEPWIEVFNINGKYIVKERLT